MSKPKKPRRRKGPREKSHEIRAAYKERVKGVGITDTVDGDFISQVEEGGTIPRPLQPDHYETVEAVGVALPASREFKLSLKHWIAIAGIVVLVVGGFIKVLIDFGADISSNSTDIDNLQRTVESVDKRSQNDRRRIEERVTKRIDRLEDSFNDSLRRATSREVPSPSPPRPKDSPQITPPDTN